MSSCHSPPDTIRLRSRLAFDQFDADRGLRKAPNLAATAPAQRPTLLQLDAEVRWLEVTFDSKAPSLRARAVVRAFDVIVSSLAIAAFAPIMALVALAVWLESRGPILYGSPRVGHDKPSFSAWKFRSMHPNADEHLAAVLENDPDARREYQVFHKLKDDPRLTRVGAFIRRTSLDELPQLFNILAGEMSVVGPRPKLLSERQAFGPALPVVLQVKPGLTGMWQVSGRNRLPVQDRVILDLEYARNRTLRGDIRICAKTFVQLWRPGKHGAY